MLSPRPLRTGCACVSFAAFSCAASSNPVATTVTRTVSPRELSSAAPNMILASSLTFSCIAIEASLTSYIRSFSAVPVKLSMTPRAPTIDVSTRGEAIAALAASIAALSPDASPIPMSADPALLMIDFTSAKSRLISPGIAMISDIPCTPWRSTSSAMRKASIIDAVLSTTFSRLSFGIVMIVSTCWRSLSMPPIAFLLRSIPSNLNGFVTTPTVSAPASLAHSATTGAAPVPVPPPMPAVMKTISAPCMASSMSSLFSSAAFSPISG